jgi:hypothetical protein
MVEENNRWAFAGVLDEKFLLEVARISTKQEARDLLTLVETAQKSVVVLGRSNIESSKPPLTARATIRMNQQLEYLSVVHQVVSMRKETLKAERKKARRLAKAELKTTNAAS